MKNEKRREFIKQLGLVAGSTALLPSLLSFDSIINTYKKEGSQKKINVALCGLGRYAKILAKGLEQTKQCKLTGLVTGTPEKEITWGQKYNIPKKNIYNYDNFDSIIDNKDIDLVYVVLPNSMHKEFTIRAANAGKHVIVEKPMGLNALECVEMIDACKKNGVQLAVGYRLHYEPHHKEIKRMGQEKVFGNIRYIDASLGYRIKGWKKDAWHLKKAMSGGGPLTNIGIYCVQSNRYILGEEPIAVTAQFGPVQRPDYFKEVEESITWQLEFPSGAVTTSASSYSYNVDRLYASGDDGFFELEPALSYGPFKGKSSLGTFNFPVINQQQVQLDEISKCILNKEPLPMHIRGEEGHKDMLVIDAIYKSAATGKKVVI
ncbi:Gfo/Idh/MocA family protein [Aquimarina agarilytica]|uniref:Gfo/Idh/MocA family protein n=1 Tax=Aquimarina agarilytica TaxID=1087449 RepID=UPI000289865F|nr:Gfo/Idh/MocA family oxidoreductase [Aquimarina agarilytica]